MNLTSKINKIYIVHYIPLVERRNYLLKYFKQNNIKNFQLRSIYQRENLSEEMYKSVYKFHDVSYMKPAVVCITLEHIEIYKDIIQNDFDSWCLILEDDSLFCKHFIEKINVFMDNVSIDAEYLDINDWKFDYKSFDYSTPLDMKNLWEPRQSTRTTGSYLIKKSTCLKLMKTLIPFENPIDNDLNEQFKTHDIKVYWSVFPLIINGGYEIGVYKTSY